MIDKLHYISQQPGNRTHLSAIKGVLDAGGKWIQLRVKNQPENIVRDYALSAKKLCEQYDAKLIINDYPAIAIETGAHGVHLGLNDMSVAEARAIVGYEMIIGGTANTFNHIQQRAAEGVNYIGLGPYRFTKTKRNLSPILHLEGYNKIMEQVKNAGIEIPIIAIGGIELKDIPALMQAGVYGVAVSGALTYATFQAQTVKNMYHELCSVDHAELISN